MEKVPEVFARSIREDASVLTTDSLKFEKGTRNFDNLVVQPYTLNPLEGSLYIGAERDLEADRFRFTMNPFPNTGGDLKIHGTETDRTYTVIFSNKDSSKTLHQGTLKAL
ncbi:MAG: hypothetical protein S4CHLAM6_09010 [Chlamydiae bacterium]|nr:hypothetical protein [Chlamydiota bacterium]